MPATMLRRGRPREGGSHFQPGPVVNVPPGAAASAAASLSSSSGASSTSSSPSPAAPEKPPSWCHSGDTEGKILTAEFKEKMKKSADVFVNELSKSYKTRNNKTPKKPPLWFRRHWKTFSEDSTFTSGGVLTVVPVTIAVWYPELYFASAPHPSVRLKANKQYCPYCSSKGKEVALEAHANIKKIVYGMEGLHVLCAKRYICRACEKAVTQAARSGTAGADRVYTYNGWHPVLLEQLPMHVRSRFDYHVYQGMSVTRPLLSFLQHSVVNGGAFNKFAKGLDEARNIEFAHHALSYYFAEVAKREFNSSAGHLGFSPVTYIVPLVSNPRSLLSGRQLSDILFSEKLKQMLDRGEVSMQYLGGCLIISADESMKLNKLTRCPVGTRTKLAEGVTSVRGNQSGCVAIVFNPDKNTNVDFIARVIQREYDSLAPEERRHFYIYVDNCCTIRDQLRSKITQLRTLPTSLPIYKLPKAVKIDVVSSHGDALNLLTRLLVDQNVERIGFDMEWPASMQTGSHAGKVAWWQIAPANEKMVYLIHTDYLKDPSSNAMHANVWNFLKSATPKKLGVDVLGDVRRMYKDYSTVPFDEQLTETVKEGIVDLRPLAKEKLKLACGLQQLSLAKITERILQKTLLKPSEIRVSPSWKNKAHDLPIGFKDYAAADARVAVDIWLELTKKSGAQKRPRQSSDVHVDDNNILEERVTGQQVLLDIFHLLQRYGRALSQNHPLFKLFMSMMSDAFYITDWTQVEELKSAIKHSQLDLDDDDLQRIGKKYFRRKVMRLVPSPDALAARVNRVYEFFVEVDKSVEDKLLVKTAHKCHLSALGHIFNGCVSDPVGVSMYRDVSSANAEMMKYLCFRGTSALEGFHRWLRSFTSAVYLDPVGMNGLLHEFMSRFNAKALIKNLGAPDFGFFEFDLLDKIAKVVEPHVGPTGYFKTNPLSVDGAYYVQRRKNNGDKFGLTPMMQAAEAEIKAALSLSDDANGDVQEAHVQLEEDVPVISIADMRPLKQPDSVALCQRLYLEMLDEDGSIDWNLLQNRYNHAVGKVKDGNGSDAHKRKYVFAIESQLRDLDYTFARGQIGLKSEISNVSIA
eukprot:g4498.t1